MEERNLPAEVKVAECTRHSLAEVRAAQGENTKIHRSSSYLLLRLQLTTDQCAHFRKQRLGEDSPGRNGGNHARNSKTDMDLVLPAQ